MLLKNKVAVITGGSRGLGFVIAQAYAREGAAVMIASRSAASIDHAVTVFESQGGDAIGMVCDVVDLEQVRALAGHAISKFGHLDIWVNNAGLSCPYGPTLTIPPEHVTNLINTNILGVYNGSMVAVQQFVQQKKGKLINLIGIGARRPMRMQNAYSSSKAWVRNFTLALAKETKESGAGVFLFNPGLIQTDMIQNLHFIKGYESRLKTFRTVTRLWSTSPDVPARKAVWLASSATDSRTGLEINLVGPRTIMQGIAREAIRLLLNRPSKPVNIEANIIEPTMDFDLPNKSAL